MNNQKREDFKSVAVKTLAIIGFLAILFLGAWGAVTVVRYLPNAFSALASAFVSLTSVFVPNERLEVTIEPATAKVGEPVVVSWEHINKRADGVYTVSYACRDGVSFDAQAQGGLYAKTFCDTPFNFVGAESSMRLIPFSAKNRFVDVPLAVSFTRTGESEPSATTEATVTLVNEGVTGSPSTLTPPAPSPTPTPSGSITGLPGTRTSNTYQITPGSGSSDPNGFVDLTVKILATGVVSTTTNEFFTTSFVPRGARGGVKFEITNIGTKTSGGWSFNAALPTNPFFIFHSVTQPSLNPGDRIEYVLGFDSVDARSNRGTITINVDPTSSVKEFNENNNLAQTTVTIEQ